METCICRQTLSGHKDDVLAISGLLPPSAFALDASCAATIAQAHGSADHSTARAAPLEVRQYRTVVGLVLVIAR